MCHATFQPNVANGSGEKKSILLVLLFLSRPFWILYPAEFYHSEVLQSGNAAREILEP